MKNKQKSLRQLAKELGVSPSYLSQIRNGKRPASAKVLSKVLNSGKQDSLDINLTNSYNNACWQRSSVVEQRTHKPPVGGSNPPAVTIF